MIVFVTIKYKHRASLARHLKYECGVEPQFICRNCNRTFKLNGSLKKHLLSCENVTPKFGGLFCDKFFWFKEYLKNHMVFVYKFFNT